MEDGTDEVNGGEASSFREGYDGLPWVEDLQEGGCTSDANCGTVVFRRKDQAVEPFLLRAGCADLLQVRDSCCALDASDYLPPRSAVFTSSILPQLLDQRSYM